MRHNLVEENTETCAENTNQEDIHTKKIINARNYDFSSTTASGQAEQVETDKTSEINTVVVEENSQCQENQFFGIFN